MYYYVIQIVQEETALPTGIFLMQTNEKNWQFPKADIWHTTWH